MLVRHYSEVSGPTYKGAQPTPRVDNSDPHRLQPGPTPSRSPPRPQCRLWLRARSITASHRLPKPSRSSHAPAHGVSTCSYGILLMKSPGGFAVVAQLPAGTRIWQQKQPQNHSTERAHGGIEIRRPLTSDLRRVPTVSWPRFPALKRQMDLSSVLTIKWCVYEMEGNQWPDARAHPAESAPHARSTRPGARRHCRTLRVRSDVPPSLLRLLLQP